MTRFVVVAIGFVTAAAASAEEYARPELLVEPIELAAWQADPYLPPDLSLIDVRAAAEWTAAALPGSVSIDIGDWKRAFGDGSNDAGWTERLRGLISSSRTRVVVYDRTLTPNATRAWWILKYWGVEDVRVLNGGVKGWQEVGLPLKTPKPPNATIESDFVAKPHPDRLATRAEVFGLATSDRPATCLIDTRSDAEVAAGVIPTATHADWVRFVDPATGKMRPADELAALLSEVGFDAERPAVAYCRSGGRASVVAFAMELMGGREVANYYGSWKDWRSDPAAPVGRLPVPATASEVTP